MTAALEVVSSTPRPHFTPGKDLVPILQEAGWPPRPVWTGGKSRPHRDSTLDRPARSQSLYRLSYRAHYIFYVILLKARRSKRNELLRIKNICNFLCNICLKYIYFFIIRRIHPAVTNVQKGGNLKYLLFSSEFNQPRIFFADFEISSNIKFKWFPTFQVATTCFSCSPPDLNSVVTNLIFCIRVK